MTMRDASGATRGSHSVAPMRDARADARARAPRSQRLVTRA